MVPLPHLNLYRFLFPDSPTNAWFLTPEERAKAVKRIQVCQLSFGLIETLLIGRTGEPNWCREQALQDGAVRTYPT